MSIQAPSAPPAETDSPANPSKPIRVAIIGNPNTGKTTLFNALTGHRARVGNYAGVTVEKREGMVRGARRPITLIDLPGTYSLSAHSADELVAVQVLLGHMAGETRPGAVVVVLDASNIERNLVLATQVLELGLPTVIVLNMMDVAEAEGLAVDAPKLSAALGVPVIPTVARSTIGLDQLVQLLEQQESLVAAPAPDVYTPEFKAELAKLAEELKAAGVGARLLGGFMVSRPLLEADGMVERLMVAQGGEAASRAIAASRERLAAAGIKLRSYEATRRYQWIRQACAEVVSQGTDRASAGPTFSDRVDAILTHRVWGTMIFVLMMAVVFQSIYAWSAPLMDLIDGFFGSAGAAAGAAIGPGPLGSLVEKGIFAGVGGVLVFLPQICILFLFIALLEDVGYMSRAAFLMDRLLSRAGLSGRSFIPMLSSFACAIPGVMAARTIEDSRDRLATILIAPLMSCSARLPVYTLMIAAFVPQQTVLGFLSLQGFVLLAMYMVGIVVAVPVAWILKKTILRARTPPFLIELPPYRRPLLANVLHRMYERASAFVLRAGTVILAISIIIWALSYYPRSADIAAEHETSVDVVNERYMALASDEGLRVIESEIPRDAEGIAGMGAGFAESGAEPPAFLADWEAELTALERHRDGEYLRTSFLGRAGRLVEPLVRPLGWDWRIGMATIASFPAREVIVSTLGVIFDLGEDAADDEEGIIAKLRDATWPDGRPLFTLPVAVGIMVFFALCMQCGATLAIMKRETNSWRWPLFAFAYMTTLAYIGALLSYQLLSLIL